MEKPKKSIFYYYTIVLIILLLLNALVFPRLLQPQVEEINYSDFLTMLRDGKVDTVELDANKTSIAILTKEDAANQTGPGRYYITAYMPDDNLTERLDDAGVHFGGVIPQESSPLVTFLLRWVLPIGIFLLMGQLLFGMMQKKMGGNAMSFGKSNAKIYAQTATGVTFHDVAGQEEAKESLMEIVDFLHNPSRYQAIGAQMPKGALLVGPPGTGKTLLAKAVAGEAKVPFFSISGSDFVEMFVGMGASRVRDLFKQAQEKAPCIVFIDEIDTIGKRRDSGPMGGNDEREQTLNQLLAEMDGFDGSKGVVILGATNRPEILDKALLRPGRFDRRIPVELPDIQGRQAILEVHAKKVQMGDVDLNVIARSTPGASGAELANIINEAALLAVKAGRNQVAQCDLEEAVETVIAGQQRKNAVVSPKEKKIVAYHEIGHALVAAKCKDGAPVHKITIVPRTSGALGYTMQVAEEETLLMSREEALDRIAVFTGGRCAEELIFHTVTSGASNDIEQATKLARAMVTRLGMSEKFDMMALETVDNAYLGGDTSLACSNQTAAIIDSEVLEIIKNCHARALRILQENEADLHRLAAYLLEKETITGEEFMAMLTQAPVEKGDN